MKVDQSIISKIEGGQRPVYDYEVTVLAKALTVSVEWLSCTGVKVGLV